MHHKTLLNLRLFMILANPVLADEQRKTLADCLIGVEDLQNEPPFFSTTL